MKFAVGVGLGTPFVGSFMSKYLALSLPLTSSLDYYIPNLRIQEFDGVDDYVELPNLPEISTSNNYSIEAGIKGDYSTSTFTIFAQSNTSTDRVNISGFSNVILTEYDGVEVTGASSSTLVNGQEYKILAVNDSGVKKLYIDDVLQVGTSAAGTSSALKTTIGARQDLDRFMIGNIDYLKIYSDATQTNLIASYDLTTSQLGSDNVKDFSGNGNHGTSFGKGEFTRTTDGTVIDHNGVINTVGTDIARHKGSRFINDDKGFSTKVGENAIKSNKSNSETIITNNIQHTNNFSVSFNIFDINTGEDTIISKIDSTPIGWTIETKDTAERIKFAARDGINSLDANIYTHSPNIWEGWTLSFNGDNNTIKSYKNGILQTINTATINDIDIESTVSIFSKNNSDNSSIILDNVIIHNTELTGEQAFQQYQFNKKGVNDVVAPENVVLHIPLNANSSNQPDISGNGNDGTFYSGGVPSVPTLVEGVYDSDESIPNATLKGIMSYEGATNLVLTSEDFSGNYTKFQSSVDFNQITAPDGTLTADKLVEDTSLNVQHRIDQVMSGLTASVSYTFSIFAKKGERSDIRLRSASDQADSIFDLDSGTILLNSSGTAKIEEYDDGWYRCSITNLTSNTSFSVRVNITQGTDSTYDGNGTSGAYIWGAMLNTGSFPMPYIKTEASAVSTTIDVAKYDVSGIITQGQGYVYAEFEYDGVNSAGFPRLIDLNDGTSSNTINLNIRNDNQALIMNVVDGGVQTVYTGPSGLTTNTLHKVLFSYDTNNCKLFLDGELARSDTSCTIPTNITKLNIGSSYANSGQLNGTIKTHKLGNAPVSDATGIRMTQL